MTVTVTSRHFKAHPSLIGYAETAVSRLSKYYDGIIKCEVVLSYEKTRRSTKIAEVILSVYRSRLAAQERTDDFFHAIDRALQKIVVQLKKYKERLHAKNRTVVRMVRAKV